mmetsp:Transcript_41792/g.65276  ORF Transcript_41792/g.65276 Transcript_41792/m.65276 type:complete len:479 (-) Transcript_41792:69-1505(-)
MVNNTVSEADVETAIRVMGTLKGQVEREIKDLETKLSALHEQTDAKFAHLSEEAYTLFAVLVHDGMAGSGHYWAYILNENGDGWAKYSDTEVTTVHEEEVWQRSVGGQNNASAYCLMYRRSQHIITEPLDAIIPATIRAEIEADNANLREEVKAWDDTQKLERFRREFNRTLDEMEGEKNPGAAEDDSSYGFEKFLHRANEPHLLHHVVATDLAFRIFGDENLDNKLKTKLDAEAKHSLTIDGQSEQTLASFQSVYCAYLGTSVAYVEHLEAQQRGDPEQAVLKLASAFITQKSREKEIRSAQCWRADIVEKLQEEMIKLIQLHQNVVHQQGPRAVIPRIISASRVICVANKSVGSKELSAVAAPRQQWSAFAREFLTMCRGTGSDGGEHVSELEELMRWDAEGEHAQWRLSNPLPVVEEVKIDWGLAKDFATRLQEQHLTLLGGRQYHSGGNPSSGLTVRPESAQRDAMDVDSLPPG